MCHFAAGTAPIAYMVYVWSHFVTMQLFNEYNKFIQ